MNAKMEIMYFTNGKGEIMRFFKLTVVLLISGVMLLFIGGKGLVVSILPAKNLNDETLDWTKLKANQHVYVENLSTDGYFYYYEKDGKTVSRIYTMVELYTGEDGETYPGYFMGYLTAEEAEYPRFDSSAEDFISWVYGESDYIPKTAVERDGYLKKMTSDEKEAIKEWIMDYDFSEEEAETMFLPYKIMKNEKPVENILEFAFGVLLFVGGVALGILSFKKN